MVQNPPAFPHPSGAQGCDGMTLRDWFAGQAIGPILASWYDDPTRIDEYGFPGDNENRELIAGFAYAMADAMLREREE